MGRPDQRHSLGRDAREDAALILKVPGTVALANSHRISAELRAALRARAMARERPAVVQGPPDLAAMIRQPAEQHLDVDPVAVDVVQVHHVGVDLVQEPQQPRRVVLGVEPGALVQADEGAVGKVAGPRGDAPLVVVDRLVATAPEDVGVDAMFDQPSVEVAHDGAG